MKKLLLIAACIVASVGLVAQTSTGGSINFLTKVSNADPTKAIDVKVLDVDGVTVINNTSSPAITAQLFAGATADSLAPVGTAINFLSSGYLNGGKTLTPLPQGSTAFVELRAWQASAGSYDAAKAGGLKWGRSDTISIVLGGDNLSPPVVPANLVGLKGFSLIPEPSTIALGALGALALLALRRK
jgi:hypothetical protein